MVVDNTVVDGSGLKVRMWACSSIRVVQAKHHRTSIADPGTQLALLATDYTGGGPGRGFRTSMFTVADV